MPRTSAITVAPSPALSETVSASRAPSLWIALPNHFSVSPLIGHDWIRLSLKA